MSSTYAVLDFDVDVKMRQAENNQIEITIAKNGVRVYKKLLEGNAGEGVGDAMGRQVQEWLHLEHMKEYDAEL